MFFKIVIFLDVTQYNLVDWKQRLREICCFHLQGRICMPALRSLLKRLKHQYSQERGFMTHGNHSGRKKTEDVPAVDAEKFPLRSTNLLCAVAQQSSLSFIGQITIYVHCRFVA
jgi:hypothetical protein